MSSHQNNLKAPFMLVMFLWQGIFIPSSHDMGLLCSLHFADIHSIVALAFDLPPFFLRVHIRSVDIVAYPPHYLPTVGQLFYAPFSILLFFHFSLWWIFLALLTSLAFSFASRSFILPFTFCHIIPTSVSMLHLVFYLLNFLPVCLSPILYLSWTLILWTYCDHSL